MFSDLQSLAEKPGLFLLMVEFLGKPKGLIDSNRSIRELCQQNKTYIQNRFKANKKAQIEREKVQLQREALKKFLEIELDEKFLKNLEKSVSKYDIVPLFFKGTFKYDMFPNMTSKEKVFPTKIKAILAKIEPHVYDPSLFVRTVHGSRLCEIETCGQKLYCSEYTLSNKRQLQVRTQHEWVNPETHGASKISIVEYHSISHTSPLEIQKVPVKDLIDCIQKKLSDLKNC